MESKAIEVRFYDDVDDRLLKFAVIAARSDGRWVFCKHKERDTLEIPGGHREPGETIGETAGAGAAGGDRRGRVCAASSLRLLRDREDPGERYGNGELRYALLGRDRPL